MRTSLLAAILLVGSAASASEATVNAGESRKPIAPAIYAANYAGMMQQEKLATYGIDLPVGELAKVALLGTFGQTSASGTFNEGPTDSPAMTPALSLFTNYDGQGGHFFEHSLSVVADRNMSVFASRDEASGKIVAVVLNFDPRSSVETTVDLLSCGPVKKQRAFQYTGNPEGLQPLEAGRLSKEGRSSVRTELPAFSMTVLELSVH